MKQEPNAILERWKAIRPTYTDRIRFPHIPLALVKQIDRCIETGQLNRAIRATLDLPDEVIPAIDRMFATASRITGLDPDEILRRTDFHHRDTSPNRIESAFAEVRTINHLHAEKFVDIEPLRASDTRRADIAATRENVSYAIEVANSIYEARGRYMPEQMKEWLVGRVVSEGKTEQLEGTADQIAAQKRVVVGIVDTDGPVIFQTHEAFARAARLSWKELGADPNTHVCLVTGRETIGYGMDDAVYPPWD